MRALSTVPTPRRALTPPPTPRRALTPAPTPRAARPSCVVPRPHRLALGSRAIRPRPPQRPVLVTKEDAARALGMSISHFQRHVQAEIKCVYSGQLSLYHYSDLERWAEQEATIGGQRA
jgi:hypothetical protein